MYKTKNYLLTPQTYANGSYTTLCNVYTDRPDNSFKQHHVKPFTMSLKVAAIATFFSSVKNQAMSVAKKKGVFLRYSNYQELYVMVLIPDAKDQLRSMLNITLSNCQWSSVTNSHMQTACSKFGCSLREMAAKKVSILPSTVLNECLKEGGVLVTYSLPQDNNMQANVLRFFV